MESESGWASPPGKYLEPSDYFPGTKLRRKRPNSIVLRFQMLEESSGNITWGTEAFSGETAACVAHNLEVLNGTHHELYMKYAGQPAPPTF